MKPYKERLPLIDAAIEYHRGMFPSYKNKPDEILWGSPRFDDIGSYQSFTNGYNPINWEAPICTYEEFSQRARELGWVNGFKWGVEYETNGEKPDLPDDVEVEFIRDYMDSFRKTKVEHICWEGVGRVFPVKKFRIVDERYKPKEKDINGWYERGELPPVGVECQFTVDVHKLDPCSKVFIEHANDKPYRPITCKVTHYGKSHFLYESQGEEYSMITGIVKFRPLRTETDKLVNEAMFLFSQTEATSDAKQGIEHAVHKLIEAGYRKIKQQTEDEFATQAQELTDYVSVYQLSKLYRAGCRFIEQVEV